MHTRRGEACEACEKRRSESLPLTVDQHVHPYGIVGHSRAIADVIRRIELVSATRSTVLITGETGTGRELVARAVHDRSAQRDLPFIKVSLHRQTCGAEREIDRSAGGRRGVVAPAVSLAGQRARARKYDRAGRCADDRLHASLVMRSQSRRHRACGRLAFLL